MCISTAPLPFLSTDLQSSKNSFSFTAASIFLTSLFAQTTASHTYTHTHTLLLAPLKSACPMTSGWIGSLSDNKKRGFFFFFFLASSLQGSHFVLQCCSYAVFFFFIWDFVVKCCCWWLRLEITSLRTVRVNQNSNVKGLKNKKEVRWKMSDK